MNKDNFTNNMYGDKVYFDFINSQDDYIALQKMLKEDESGRLTLSKRFFNPVLDENYDEFIKNYRKGITDDKKVLYLVKLKDKKTIIGTVTLNEIDAISRNSKVVIYINNHFRGNGYGLDAMNTLKKVAFLNYNLNKLYLVYYEYNKGVGEFYKKAGFIHEGELKEDVYMNGKYYSVFCMGAFARDL